MVPFELVRRAAERLFGKAGEARFRRPPVDPDLLNRSKRIWRGSSVDKWGVHMKRRFILLAGCSALLVSSPALAQSAQPASDPAEIVVTANKRQENINKVGLTITAISAEALAVRRISSIEDIAASVPGLTFTTSATSTPILTLRGIGFNAVARGECLV